MGPPYLGPSPLLDWGFPGVRQREAVLMGFLFPDVLLTGQGVIGSGCPLPPINPINLHSFP